MSNTEKEPNIHKVKIQQTYWARDTTEEKITEMGAIRTAQVVEEVEYYDTDLYDLAVNESWLSKTGKKWQLIIDKAKATALKVRSTSKKPRQVNSVDTKTPMSLSYEAKQDVQKTDVNGNSELETAQNVTCYELVDEKKIIACLSRILNINAKLDNIQMSKFFEMAGIQKYTSVSHVTEETFRLRDIYKIVIKGDGVPAKKSVVISLNVEIDNVTQGFQWIEQLAKELDLQAQHV